MYGAKNFLLKNKSYFRVCIFLWTAALICGVYFALGADSESFAQTKSFSEKALNSESSFLTLFADSAVKNIKFTVAYCLCSSFIITLPFSLMLASFKGYSAGFAAASVIRMYGAKGCGISFAAFVIPHCIFLPVLLVMFTLSLKYQINSFKNRKSSVSVQRKKQWILYASAMAVLCLVLCLCSAFEALVVPLITKLVI